MSLSVIFATLFVRSSSGCESEPALGTGMTVSFVSKIADRNAAHPQTYLIWLRFVLMYPIPNSRREKLILMVA
jgi:hypothetical protein